MGILVIIITTILDNNLLQTKLYFNILFYFVCLYLVVNFFNASNFHWHFALEIRFVTKY